MDFRGRTGRRGYRYFFLVPFVGTIVLLVFLATEGTRSDNGHGPAPRLATDS